MIRVEGLVKTFGEKKVLTKVNCTINRGETFLIIGRSGAGKSVLLRSIVGLIKPDSGNIFINGEDITALNKKQLRKVRENIGIVFQGNALLDFLSVEENVGFFLYQNTNIPRSEIRKKVRETLGVVGLEGTENLYPHELSGGMKKRVAIARSIIYKPQIIIYDEPTTGVDPIAVDKIVSLIEDLHKQFRITSIIVTHDLQVGLTLADRLAFLLGGRIIFEGTKEQLRELKDERIIQFMQGSSSGPIRESEV
ncbi:MAG: ABC transporter ATP-binding protein [Candidatus Omnitrophota bacterium]